MNAPESSGRERERNDSTMRHPTIQLGMSASGSRKGERERGGTMRKAYYSKALFAC